jgi:hypothetical protein
VASPTAGRGGFDDTPMGGDYTRADKIDMEDADYLKQLIYLTSGGRRIVREGTKGMQLVRVDLHKQEATNGCIFIVDEFTPPLSNPALLNRFEPQLIKDIQSEVGARTRPNIGTMNVLSVL